VPDALARRLGDLGFRLDPTADPGGGLRFLRPEGAGDLTMDITPPALDGEALLSEVRRSRRPCLVIASTTLDAEALARLAEAGAVLALDAKARPLASLLATVEAALLAPAGKASHG
jgi:DNA-binding response OmpR family regulator